MDVTTFKPVRVVVVLVKFLTYSMFSKEHPTKYELFAKTIGVQSEDIRNGIVGTIRRIMSY